MLRAGGDDQRAAGLAHDAGNQRQGIGDGRRTARQFLGDRPSTTTGAVLPCPTGSAVAFTSTLSRRASEGTSVSSTEAESPMR